MTEEVNEENSKRPIAVRITLFLFAIILLSVGLLGLFLYFLEIYVLIPQSVGAFDIISTFGSLLLTALLVVLYGTMWRTQQTQTEIQQNQTRIQENQTKIMALNHKPDVEIELKGINPDTARDLQFEIRNKAQNGQARNFRIRSKIQTGLEEDDIDHSTGDEKYIGWPCESELKQVSQNHNEIVPLTCNPGEKICLEGRTGFTISNANERQNNLPLEMAHEKLLDVEQTNPKIIIEFVFEDRIDHEYSHKIIERNLDFDEPVDLKTAYEDGTRVSRPIKVMTGDPRQEKSSEQGDWRERLEQYLPRQ